MQTPRHLLPLLAALTLAGCARLPIHTAHLPESQLRKVSEYELCAAYASTEAARLQSEIDRRNLIPAEQWKMVAQHQVTEGMSSCAVLASLGYPADSEEVSSDDGSCSPDNPCSDLVYLNDLSVISYRVEVRGGVAAKITR